MRHLSQAAIALAGALAMTGILTMPAHAELNRVVFPADLAQLVHYATVRRGASTEHIMTTPEATTAPAGAATALPRSSYGSDHERHPVAALFAVGLPAALLVAVALSPMIMVAPPKSQPMQGTLIDLPKSIDPPPPQPTDEAQPTEKTASATDTVKSTIDTNPATDNRVEQGPVVVDAGPIDPGPPARPADPPPLPKLVFAELDPRYAGAFQPDYPASEQRREIEGVVKVRVLIGTDGRVKAV